MRLPETFPPPVLTGSGSTGQLSLSQANSVFTRASPPEVPLDVGHRLAVGKRLGKLSAGR